MDDIYFSPQPVEIDLNDEFPESPLSPEDNFEPEEEKPRKTKKKKKHRLLKFFIKFIAAVLVLLTLFIMIVSAASGYTRNDLKANEYTGRDALYSNPFVTNILLIGIDEETDDTSRSDSMILLSLDYIHGKIKMASFLRDSWVVIPNSGNYHKLNASMIYGGSQLVCDTLEYNFRTDIDHYLKVNFQMFTGIIDKLGGIDIEITDSEAAFINKTTRYTVSSGKSVHIDGNVALVYSRIRKLDSDYMRTFRQRKVITAIINKVKHTNIIDLFSMVREVLPLLETDLNCLEIASLFYKGGFAFLAFDIQQIRIPTEELMYADYRNGQWVEIIDLEGCRQQLHDFIYQSYKQPG